MKLTTRIGAAALSVLAGAVVAAGCGDSGDGGGGEASGKALDLVPKSAIGYATVDLDFEGDAWKKLDALAGAFDEDYDRGELLKDVTEGDDEDADFKKDVEPWLGKSAGAAVNSLDIDVAFAKNAKDGEGAEAFAWVDIEDRSALEKYLEQEKYSKDGSIGDFEAWQGKDEDGDVTHLAVSDDLMLLGKSKKSLEDITSFDGDSVSSADGIDDITGDLKDDGLVSVVINGAGVRDAVKKSKDAKQLGDLKALDDFKGAAMQFTPEDDGARLHVLSKGMKSEDAKTGSDVFTALPENTVFALGGHDLGGGLEDGIDSLASNKEIGGAVTQITALLGVDAKQMGEAFDGEFALALSGTDAGLQSLIGTVVAAVVSKSAKGVNPSAVAKNAAITLAFEKGEETSETLDKLVGGASKLLQAPPSKTATAGDFQTKSSVAFGLPLTVASSSDVAALAIGADVFTTWGDAKLGDNDTFKAAWDAAGAPDDAAGSMWFDYPRVAKLAELKSADGVEAGGWIGYGSQDGDTASFDVFMHVKK